MFNFDRFDGSDFFGLFRTYTTQIETIKIKHPL